MRVRWTTRERETGSGSFACSRPGLGTLLPSRLESPHAFSLIPTFVSDLLATLQNKQQQQQQNPQKTKQNKKRIKTHPSSICENFIEQKFSSHGPSRFSLRRKKPRVATSKLQSPAPEQRSDPPRFAVVRTILSISRVK